jgi:hypothetical protein
MIMPKHDFLEAGEELIDTWTINYRPPTGGFYNGKLHVTNNRVLFDARFEISAKGIVLEAYAFNVGSYMYVAIPKSHIKDVEEKSTFFKKQAILTLTNGEKHIFDYGMLSVKKVIEAIKQ